MSVVPKLSTQFVLIERNAPILLKTHNFAVHLWKSIEFEYARVALFVNTLTVFSANKNGPTTRSPDTAHHTLLENRVYVYQRHEVFHLHKYERNKDVHVQKWER